MGGAAEPGGRGEGDRGGGRSHWGIENQLHWVLDVAFREDASRAHIGHSAENSALLRKLALNLPRIEPTRKHGVKASRLRVGWDNTYLLRVLGIL